MIKIKVKKYQLITSGVALLVGLAISVGIFNHQQDKLVKFDVTWLDSHQAIIFWKTPDPTTGYIKYGEQKFNLSQTVTQTTEQASELHVVVLENLPLEGVFVTLHRDQESIFRRPKAINIKYEAQENEPH